MSSVELVGINLHPVKSTAIRPVSAAYVDSAGLAGDRQWMVVDADGALVSARELPALFHLVAETAETGMPVDAALRLSCLRAEGPDPLEVELPADGERPVRVFGDPIVARSAGAEADRWLHRATGRDDLALVWCPPGSRVRTAFHDASPVSLVSTASVDQLARWLPEPGTAPVPVQRFRPNLVVAGDLEPFAEDGWGVVRIGEAELEVAKPISRCVMTTIDPATLAGGKDPIRTLARHRRWDGKTWFAVHLRVRRTGRIAVGDEVVVAG